MGRHPGEHCIAVDHWAALVIEGGKYSVLTVANQGGSVGPDGNFVADREKGVPGVWLKEVVDGKVVSRLLPSSGLLSDILRPAKEIIQDPRIPALRRANPAF